MYLVQEILCLKKLKNILQYDYIFYILLIISLLFSFLILNIDVKSNYNEKTNKEIGYITDYKIKKDKI